MITTLPMEVRKHSWWRSTDDDNRLFVIVELPIDFDHETPVHYTRVGLLEANFDEAMNIPIETFLREFNEGRIRPVNVSARSLADKG